MEELGTFLGDPNDKSSGAWAMWELKKSLDDMEKYEYLPSQVIPKITAEATKIGAAMSQMEADFGEVKIKPVLEAIMGYEGEHKIVISPEAVNLTVKMKVQIDAADLAVGIAKGNKDTGGFFEVTQQVDRAALDLDGGGLL